MKIKSVKPTNKFAEIEFKEIIDNPTDKKVYTPSGFKPVLACEFMKTNNTVVLSHAGGTLKCDPDHRVLTNSGLKHARQLDPVVDRLINMSGQPVDFVKRDGPVADLYDIQIDEPHLYYTSGLVSHNSIFLCNNAINSVKQGLDTLLVTFEMPEKKVALRCLGALTSEPLSILNHKIPQSKRDKVLIEVRSTLESHGGKLVIAEMPPDECSVNNVHALISQLKRSHGWAPKVVCLDYLELMVSRRDDYNKEEYLRQKHVATETCSLAKKEQVLVYTATQTNRSGSGNGGRAAGVETTIDLNQAAESYGKMMPMDYVISLNQNEIEHGMSPPRVRGFVAKNRNGTKHNIVPMTINYTNMQVRQDG